MVFKRFCKDNKGFTLIEVMAVVAVSAILLMIIWPRAPLLSRWKLETAAQDLAGDLRLIRQAAITTGKSCEIALFTQTVTGGNYRIKQSNLSAGELFTR